MTATDEEKDWRRLEITNLIERLRAKPEKGFELSPLMNEAAREIEILRVDRDQWKQVAGDNLSSFRRAQGENKLLFEFVRLLLEKE